MIQIKIRYSYNYKNYKISKYFYPRNSGIKNINKQNELELNYYLEYYDKQQVKSHFKNIINPDEIIIYVFDEILKIVDITIYNIKEFEKFERKLKINKVIHG